MKLKKPTNKALPKPEKTDELVKKGTISTKGFTCLSPCRGKNPVPINWEIRHRVTPYESGKFKGEALDEHYVVLGLPPQVSCSKCRKKYDIKVPSPEEQVIQRHYLPKEGKLANSFPSFGDAKEPTLQTGLVKVIQGIRFSSQT